MATNGEAFHIVRQKSGHKERSEHLFQHVLQGHKNLSPEQEATIYSKIKAFVSNVEMKWQASNRDLGRFSEKYNDWLSTETTFYDTPSKVADTGPSKDFKELGDRQKRRRTEKLRSETSLDELLFSTISRLRQAGRENDAALLTEVCENNSSKEILKVWREHKDGKLREHPLSSDEALSLCMELDLTKREYCVLREVAVAHNSTLIPPYHLLTESKKNCYPNPTSVQISAKGAEVTMQGLLDHTTGRILIDRHCVLEQLSEQQKKNLCLVSKFGMDGTSNFLIYSHTPRESETPLDPLRNAHASVFVTSLVPLQLFSKGEGGQKLIVWQNPRPSSVRFCRPLKFEYEKETDEKTRENHAHFTTQIKCLQKTVLEVRGMDLEVQHSVHLTMVDGKAANALTFNKASSNCNLCGSTPNTMNNIQELLNRPVKRDALQFGLSVLHCWIRFMECVLHISYRLLVKQWRVSQALKPQVVVQENKVKTALRNELGLLVDTVQQGVGSCNNGNTARKFFEYPDKTAEATGVDVEVIQRFAIILRALSSGYEINIEAFRNYCAETAHCYVTKYDWYKMPASIHKVLIHGADIVNQAPLPIGMFSEEPQEAGNKIMRRKREGNTRKMTPELVNEDTLHILLQYSDPHISSLRKLPSKKSQPFPSSVIALLQSPHVSSRIEPDQDLEEENDDED